jgi:hypothetical protein
MYSCLGLAASLNATASSTFHETCLITIRASPMRPHRHRKIVHADPSAKFTEKTPGPSSASQHSTDIPWNGSSTPHLSHDLQPVSSRRIVPLPSLAFAFDLPLDSASPCPTYGWLALSLHDVWMSSAAAFDLPLLGMA